MEAPAHAKKSSTPSAFRRSTLMMPRLGCEVGEKGGREGGRVRGREGEREGGKA